MQRNSESQTESQQRTLCERIVALDFERLAPCIGHELGVSEWVEIDQDLINSFGASTLDPDPMHVDVAWAKANSPFGQTILFGFQTMSLLTWMLHNVLSRAGREYHEVSVGLNYGFDRLRLITPVSAGSKVRGRFALNDVRIRDATSCIQKYDVVVEIMGEDEKAALLGQWLVLWARKGENTLASGS